MNENNADDSGERNQDIKAVGWKAKTMSSKMLKKKTSVKRNAESDDNR